MSTIRKGSELILNRLKIDAQTLDRPEIRLATIERLVMACDKLETGEAANEIGAYSGISTRRSLTINPTNIEKYVKTRQRRGDEGWTGPTRTFIASDRSLNAYVKAREDERLKPPSLRKETPRRRMLEDAIGSIQEIEKRQILREELEKGRVSAREIELIRAFLRTLPGVDIGAILQSPSRTVSVMPASFGAPSELDENDIKILAALVMRLQDASEMRRAGLELDGNRLRLASPPRTTIVRPVEMALLQRLARVFSADRDKSN